MVLRHRDCKMASEQPVKKKLRRTNEDEAADEPDFIHNINENGVRADFSALHVNEDDITLNTINIQLHNIQSNAENGSSTEKSPPNPSKFVSTTSDSVNMSIQPTNHDRTPQTQSKFSQIISHDSLLVRSETNDSMSVISTTENTSSARTSDLTLTSDNNSQILTIPGTFQDHLVKQCFCGISESVLREPFKSREITDFSGTRTLSLTEWSISEILQFLSNLQMLFDVYLKQNNKGHICARLVEICDALVQNEYSLVEQVISLCEVRDKYVTYLSARVLSSFFIVAKASINNEWLESVVRFLTVDESDFNKMIFALEVIKRVVEWKDIEIHVLESENSSEFGENSSNASEFAVTCSKVSYSDPESFDTSAIKGLIIKSLETKWPDLIHKIQTMISQNNCVQSQTCILTFLALWESTISVKANLSVIDTKPFYAHLEIFVALLTSSLSPIVWKQLLSLFNEVLCYGSTLALQDMLPDDTCQLAHLIVRYVKDFRLLDSLPFRRAQGCTVNAFVGTVARAQSTQPALDKTLLQKMVLLVLKSVAVTIKETRSDSSDSSVGSDDFDFYQDMQLIERSIRDVLKKVDVFIKNALDFHPETPFSKVLVHLFSDQDDYMIEAMVCTLDITVGISYRNAVFPDLISMLNPIHSFVEFLRIVAHDSDVLLDYLVSNETCFLLYLLRFLKYVKRNWSKFVSSCYEGNASGRTNELDNTMTVLIRLKTQISRLVSKELFPYNINPVLRLLSACESFYEGNEYS